MRTSTPESFYVHQIFASKCLVLHFILALRILFFVFSFQISPLKITLEIVTSKKSRLFSGASVKKYLTNFQPNVFRQNSANFDPTIGLGMWTSVLLANFSPSKSNALFVLLENQ